MYRLYPSKYVYNLLYPCKSTLKKKSNLKSNIFTLLYSSVKADKFNNSFNIFVVNEETT